MITPEYFLDEDLATISAFARLLYIGLWQIADDINATLPFRPRWIKAQIFPYNDVNIDELLNELINLGKLLPFEKEENKFLFIKNFKKHQRVEKPSKERKYPEYSPPTTQPVGEDSVRARGGLGDEVKISISKVKRSVSKDNTNVLQQAAVYGNQDINSLLAYLKEKLKLPLLDESEKVNRRYAYLCVRKFGMEKTKLAIDATAQSRFWHTKVTSFKKLYYNAVQIVSSNRGGVRSVDATKVLDSKNEGRQRVPAVGGGVPGAETKLAGGVEYGVVPKVFN